MSSPTRREVLAVLSTASFAALLGGSFVAHADSTGRPDYFSKTLDIEHLWRLQRDMGRVLSSGLVTEHPTIRKYFAGFEYSPPEDFPDARSLLVIAARDPIVELDVHHGGVHHRLVAAPGYTRADRKPGALLERVLADAFGEREVRKERARLPVKLLAARAGLAEYGRNNIAYVDGLGSYLALIAFYTDQPATGRWHPVRRLRQCRSCRLCVEECPTKAIHRERPVIDAGRCVSLYNELAEPMPEWIPAEAHNTLVGCMRCQLDCPANRELIDEREWLAALDERETAVVLAGGGDAAVEESIRSKLARFTLAADLAHFGQNLRLLLEGGNPVPGRTRS